jgi:PAS domain S-box-containing protein
MACQNIVFPGQLPSAEANPSMDVTEQEQLTKELQRREAYLAKAQRLSHTGTFGWNASTDEHFWSEETFRIFEFAPSSKVSLQMILERIHPEDMPSVKMAIAAATRGERIDIEYRLLMSDGRIKYLHVVGEVERRETASLEVIGAVMDVTARKLTEVELRRSKAHLADAQRLSRTGSVGMEGSTKRIFWSEEAARIYGYPPGAEPTPDLILQRVHPDDVDLLKNALERAAQGGSDFDFEHRLLMPDGSIKHIYNLSHYLRDETGNEEVVGAIMDVTERKLAEEAIRRSEAYLAEAQRLSHSGSFGWKVSSGEIFWSDETFRIFQYDPDTKPTLEFALTRVHPKDRELVQQQIEQASRDGKAFDFENRLQMPDGSMKHVRVTAHPSRDGAGNLEFVGAVTDVSDHRQAEAMIRERQSELQQILDLAPQHIGVFGPDGSPLYANRATLEYLGVGIDRWRDETARYSLVHPDDRERFLGERKRRFLEGAPYEFEVRLLGHDGKIRWFLFRLNPLKDERGQITRWYSTGIDIEERKQAEDTLRRENVALREEIDKASMFEEIVGTSPALKAVLSRISKVAPSDSTVVITGETGTGKELVARAIHRRSNRASRAFVSLNCAAIPRDLIASELFGHEKGAFTGATQQRAGRFELANGGTLFLDEVGELPSETQIALLRVLQEHEFERVGGTRPIRADVRVIAATNRDLQAAIRVGSFRSDLFYRLHVFPLEVPPLRERSQDIPLLVEYFIDRYARKAGKNIRVVDKKSLKLLNSYAWPGNVRELQNVVERSVILCDSDIFSIDENWLLPQTIPTQPTDQAELHQRLQAQEKDMIEAALRESRGKVFGPRGAAAKLGIARSTLESKIRSLKINKNRFKSSIDE